MPVSLFERAPIERYGEAKAAWEAEAAGLVATMLERWRLTPGAAFTGGEAGAVLAVTTADGRDAVLKVGFPHHEAVGEALALEAWSPGLAPRVLRQDAWTWSMLLERVHPGTPLSRAGLPAADAIAVAGGLLARLHTHSVPEGVPAIADVVGIWLDNAEPVVARTDAPADLVAAVRAALADAVELLHSDRASAFLHGDANPGNLLLSTRGVWQAIDPKPMVGDAEFDLAPAAEQIGDPWAHVDPAPVARHHLDSLVAATGSDRSRALRWAVVRSALDVVWAWGDGNATSATAAARRLMTWRELSAS
ncbi:aminoglycoside phosphotransferase family protein [Salinibacterium soli]|uniref:Aminoglycoside phosphotransferase family protein n=1 Tax=Antiquaquibacter soli TaxID=3064523 RepID=A0ABT9BLM0_9MICO|nr:aminoglycoside phosphotransferase family protein [Protaetiibacter sp. WY-16]MDO7881912.1 aminoglycoside phosphotransferase family protein [Protaetiibacter sp. WY-16]